MEFPISEKGLPVWVKPGQEGLKRVRKGRGQVLNLNRLIGAKRLPLLLLQGIERKNNQRANFH